MSSPSTSTWRSYRSSCYRSTVRIRRSDRRAHDVRGRRASSQHDRYGLLPRDRRQVRVCDCVFLRLYV